MKRRHFVASTAAAMSASCTSLKAPSRADIYRLRLSYIRCERTTDGGSRDELSFNFDVRGEGWIASALCPGFYTKPGSTVRNRDYYEYFVGDTEVKKTSEAGRGFPPSILISVPSGQTKAKVEITIFDWDGGTETVGILVLDWTIGPEPSLRWADGSLHVETRSQPAKEGNAFMINTIAYGGSSKYHLSFRLGMGRG